MPSNEQPGRLRVGQRVFWIDEQFLKEELREATVLSVVTSTKSTLEFIRTIPPRRHYQPDVPIPASAFFTSAAAAWRSLAAERRVSAKDHQTLAEEFERRAQEAEAKAA